MKVFGRLMLICAMGAIGAFRVGAAILITVTFDENGNGSYTELGVTHPLASGLAADPGPGGLSSVLTYVGLPLPGVQGDLGLTDGGTTEDWIRFNGNGTIVFYSSNVSGVDSIADQAWPLAGNYTNLVTIPEVASGGGDGATWSPAGVQPGAGNSDFTLSYNIISDVPEPGSAALMVIAMAGMAALRVRRRRS